MSYFLVVAVSVFSRSTGILEHEHCMNTEISQFSILVITILLHSGNYTPANCMHGSKVRRARSVVRRKDAIAIDGPRWTAFAAVNVRVSPVAKADARSRDVVVVVSGIV